MENTNEKIVLVDFCETIANFQTLDPFLEYVIRKVNPQKYYWICSPAVTNLCSVMTRIMQHVGITYYVYKHLLVKQLKGLGYNAIVECGKEYYREKVRDNLIMPTVELLRELQKEQYRIVILSGGSDFYIRCFADEIGIRDVLSAEFGFAGSVCTGKIKNECLGENKVISLKKYIEEKKITGVFSIGISDSQSDISMLKLCERKIVISHHKHQNWITNDMEEIIWD